MQTQQTPVHEVLDRKAIGVERIELMVDLAVDADAINKRLASRASRNKDGTAKFMRGEVVVQATRCAR
jgi:hypothetical protein